MNNHLTIKQLFKKRAYLIREANQIDENQLSNIVKSTRGTAFLNLKNVAQDLRTVSQILSEIAYKQGLILIYEQSLKEDFAANPSTINTWTKGLISNFKGSSKATLKTIPAFVVAFPKTKGEAEYISTELNRKSILFAIVGTPQMRSQAAPYHIDAQADLPELARLYLSFLRTAIKRGNLKRVLKFQNQAKSS